MLDILPPVVKAEGEEATNDDDGMEAALLWAGVVIAPTMLLDALVADLVISREGRLLPKNNHKKRRWRCEAKEKSELKTVKMSVAVPVDKPFIHANGYC